MGSFPIQYNQYAEIENYLAAKDAERLIKSGQIEVPAENGYFDGYLSPQAWKDWWYSGNEAADAPTGPAKSAGSPAGISNPEVLKIYNRMEKTVKQHGPLLSKELGYVAFAELLTKDGSIVELTIDMRKSTGKVSLGKPPVTPDFIMKMKDDVFVKLIQAKINPTTAFMYGQLKIAGSKNKAIKWG